MLRESFFGGDVVLFQKEWRCLLASAFCRAEMEESSCRQGCERGCFGGQTHWESSDTVSCLCLAQVRNILGTWRAGLEDTACLLSVTARPTQPVATELQFAYTTLIWQGCNLVSLIVKETYIMLQKKTTIHIEQVIQFTAFTRFLFFRYSSCIPIITFTLIVRPKWPNTRSTQCRHSFTVLMTWLKPWCLDEIVGPLDPNRSTLVDLDPHCHCISKIVSLREMCHSDFWKPKV